MPKRDPAKLTSVKIKIPWVGEAEWNADPKERNAAWRFTSNSLRELRFSRSLQMKDCCGRRLLHSTAFSIPHVKY